MPSSRKTGAAIATDPSISSPSLVAMPVITMSAKAVSQSCPSGVVRSDSGAAPGEYPSRPRPAPERQQIATAGRRRRAATSSPARGSPGAARRSRSGGDRSRRALFCGRRSRLFAGLLDLSSAQHRIGMTDEPLAADVRAGADEELWAEPELTAMAIDEAEVAKRPQVSIDRRDRHLEQGAQLVGPDLSRSASGQQGGAVPGRRRGVFGGFLRRASGGRPVGSRAAGIRGGRRNGPASGRPSAPLVRAPSQRDGQVRDRRRLRDRVRARRPGRRGGWTPGRHRRHLYANGVIDQRLPLTDG